MVVPTAVLFRKDVRILEFFEGAMVDVTGVNAINICDLNIAQGAGVMSTVGDGDIIAVMSQYANLGEG